MAGDCDMKDLVAFLRQNHAKELDVVSGRQNRGSSRSTCEENKPDQEGSLRKAREGPSVGVCMVCEDPKGSVHFGVISCAACSAFFRRTVSENRKYTCRRSSEGHFNCPIDQKHRCYCRACRLQKCLLMGMDPGSVQLHRDTYGSKHLKRAQTQSDSQRQISSYSVAGSGSLSKENAIPVNVLQEFKDQSLVLSPSTVNLPLHLLSFSQSPAPSKEEMGSFLPHLETDTAVNEGNFAVVQETRVSPQHFLFPTSRSVSTNQGSDDDISQNIVEVMVKSYRQMLERRRLVYCPSSIRDIIGGTAPTITPACYFGERVRRDRLRVDIALLVEFLNSISPFPNLDVDDRVVLMKHFSVAFSILEKYYITMRAGGLQTNRIFHSDGTYSDLDDLDSIAKEANKVAGQDVDRQTLNKLFVQSLKDFLWELSGPMYHNNMTDVEFCALTAVLLFDPSVPGLSDNGSHVVRQTRDRVYNDWFELYERVGIEDMGQRVGNTMLLLPAVQTIVDTTQENFRLIQIFDLFHYDKILDELMYLNS